jgi:hypothetical protein
MLFKNQIHLCALFIITFTSAHPSSICLWFQPKIMIYVFIYFFCMQEEFDNLSDIFKEWLGPPTTRCHSARALNTAQPGDSVAAAVAQLGTEIRVKLPLSLSSLGHSMGKWALFVCKSARRGWANVIARGRDGNMLLCLWG